MKKTALSARAGIPLDDAALAGVAGGFGEAGVLSSGTLRSNTGTQMDMLVEWSVSLGAGDTKVLHVNVCADAYALSSSQGSQNISLYLNGERHLASSSAIDYTGTARAQLPLASFEILNAPGGPNQLDVEWFFNGSYGGTELVTITASGVINI